VPASVQAPPSAPEPATNPARDPAFDLARGVGIIVVLLHHWSNNAARLYTHSGGPSWWALTLLNRVTAFSVPLFLLVSCVLAGRALNKDPDPLSFYRKRLPGVLHPYLVWTLIFWLLTLASSPGARHLKGGIPEFFTHPMARLSDLFWGKASFHLYFLVVLIQVLLFMPALFWKPIRAITEWAGRHRDYYIGWLVIQFAILELQHTLFKLPYPASTFLWYASAWWLGAILGPIWGQRRWHPATFAIPLVLVLAVYGWSVWGELSKHSIDGMLANEALAAYGGIVAFAVLGFCASVPVPQPNAALLYLGKNTLAIYLVHPIFLVLLAAQPIRGLLSASGIGPILELVLLVALTLGAVEALRILKLERPLLGRG
jgi:fucose 4-O-acetylase-like acetyltransferase